MTEDIKEMAERLAWLCDRLAELDDLTVADMPPENLAALVRIADNLPNQSAEQKATITEARQWLAAVYE